MPRLKELIELMSGCDNSTLLIFYLNQVRDNYSIHLRNILEKYNIRHTLDYDNLVFNVSDKIYFSSRVSLFGEQSRLLSVHNQNGDLCTYCDLSDFIKSLSEHQHNNIANEYRSKEID